MNIFGWNIGCVKEPAGISLPLPFHKGRFLVIVASQSLSGGCSYGMKQWSVFSQHPTPKLFANNFAFAFFSSPALWPIFPVAALRLQDSKSLSMKDTPQALFSRDTALRLSPLLPSLLGHEMEKLKEVNLIGNWQHHKLFHIFTKFKVCSSSLRCYCLL